MCSISFSYVKLYLSQRKKGVSAISKSVRNQYLEFLAETGMTRYEFSKRSGILESTLWSLGQKEDYDVRESNIRKIAKGMGVPASDLFNADCARPGVEPSDRQPGRKEIHPLLHGRISFALKRRTDRSLFRGNLEAIS